MQSAPGRPGEAPTGTAHGKSRCTLSSDSYDYRSTVLTLADRQDAFDNAYFRCNVRLSVAYSASEMTDGTSIQSYSLFDMDGTLVDSTAGVIGAWELFKEKYPQLDVTQVLSGELDRPRNFLRTDCISSTPRRQSLTACAQWRTSAATAASRIPRSKR